MTQHISIIAESAANHNGSYDNLISLAKASKDSGADFFTFQVVDEKYFCDKSYPSRKVVQDVSFSKIQWTTFFKFAKKFDIKLIPCPCDIGSLRFVLKNRFEIMN